MINCDVVATFALADVTAAIFRVVNAFGLVPKIVAVVCFLVVIASGFELGVVTVLVRAWFGAVVFLIDVETVVVTVAVTVLASCEIVLVIDTVDETLAMSIVASVFGCVIAMPFESASTVVAASVEDRISFISVVCCTMLSAEVSVLVSDTSVVVAGCESVLADSEVISIMSVVCSATPSAEVSVAVSDTIVAVAGCESILADSEVIPIISVVCSATLFVVASVVVFEAVVVVGGCETVLGASAVIPIIFAVTSVASAILLSVVAIMKEVLVPCDVDAEVWETAAFVAVNSALGVVTVVTFSLLVLLIVVVLVSIFTVVVSDGVVSILIAEDATFVIIVVTGVVVTTAIAAVLDSAKEVNGNRAVLVIVTAVDGVSAVVSGITFGEEPTTVELPTETDARKDQHDES